VKLLAKLFALPAPRKVAHFVMLPEMHESLWVIYPK
jgi:hypothetical protein